MTYKMDFDLASKTGTVVLNLSLIERGKLERSVPLMSECSAAGYAMGKLMALLRPGEQVGHGTIPEGSVGIGTVCSITMNGVLVAHGIPTHSRFGGLLELRDGKPTRFAEFINYDGTTLDPLEIFIRSVMTDYVGRDADRERAHRRQFPRGAGRQPRPRPGARGEDGKGRPRRSILDRLAGPVAAQDPRQRRPPGTGRRRAG